MALVHGGERFKVLGARATKGSGAPGTVIVAPLVVACGTGALELTRVQRAGGRAIAAADYVNARPELRATAGA